MYNMRSWSFNHIVTKDFFIYVFLSLSYKHISLFIAIPNNFFTEKISLKNPTWLIFRMERECTQDQSAATHLNLTRNGIQVTVFASILIIVKFYDILFSSIDGSKQIENWLIFDTKIYRTYFSGKPCIYLFPRIYPRIFKLYLKPSIMKNINSNLAKFLLLIEKFLLFRQLSLVIFHMVDPYNIYEKQRDRHKAWPTHF